MNHEALLARIERELSGRAPTRAAPGSFDTEAAVALLLRPASRGLEFLTIKRTESERDPWSGQMALPGGRREPRDEDLWATAVRETYEEVGLDLLQVGRRLGQLDDVAPRSRLIPAISITPFVVAVKGSTVGAASSEVQYALWLPIEVLADERNQGRLKLEALPDREFPTVEYGGSVIWGLTLAILRQFEEVLESVGYRTEPE